MIGTFLLLYRFPAVPVGLHQDEMSEAYESLALLRTGADRWGYHFPLYFVSWGSGQNVLQAYLNIPFVAVFGLSRLGARLLPMLLNIGSLPLFFLAVRRWYGNRPALLALAFLAFSPWHIMLSRWGIENSPLPFFLALGLFTFGRAAGTASPWRIIPAFLPFAAAMYTYGVTIVAIPLLLVFLIWLDLVAVCRALKLWIGATALFSFLVAPLAFFTLKNYVLKRNFAFESHLPFTIPLLPRSRLEEASNELRASSVVHHNIKFFAFQMADNRHNFMQIWPWYQLPDVHSVQTVLYILFWLGFGVLFWRSVRARRPIEPFVPWVLSCAVIFKAVALNTSRAGILYLPILALASYGFFFLLDRLRSTLARHAAWALLAILVLWPMVRFVREYYGPVYAHEIADSFYPDMPAAIHSAEQLAGPDMPIYFSEHILLNYADVLFLKKVDPVAFQHSGATWNHPHFGRFYFQRDSLRTIPHPFVYVVPDWEVQYPDTKQAYCRDPHWVAVLDELEVGVCP